MSAELLNWFSYISTAFSIVSLLVGLVYIRAIRSYLIPVFISVCIAALVEIINLIISDYALSNIPILHLYTIFEFTLLYLFYLLFYKQYFKVGSFYFLLPVFILVTYIDYKKNGLNEMDSFSVTVESSIFILCSIFSFFYIMRKLIFENILESPFFWINSGILIYFSGNILLFIFSNSLDQTNYYFFWSTIHSLLNVIYNSVVCIAFRKSLNK
jgi:hypothetical protein